LFDGLALGFWLAFAVLNGIQYLTLYAGLLIAAILIRAFRVLPPQNRARAAVQLFAAGAMCLALTGWRLLPVLLVLRHDQREWITTWDVSVAEALRALLVRPEPEWSRIIPGRHHATYIELVSYVGPVVIALAGVSVYLRWRWWHTFSLITGWLALGSVRWYHPSYWLSSWPLFSSAHVVTRWRYVALLGLGLAAGSVVAHWRRSINAYVRSIAAFLTLIIGSDLVLLAYQQFPLAFSIAADSRFFPGPPIGTIVNVRDGKGYPCVLRGYGVIRGYEPMLSYRRDAPTLRKAREDPDYRGEAWTANGPIEPVYWSPNRIVFQLKPGQDVYVNQNPGSWWWANGRPAFPDRRCAELMVPFIARADASGRLELEIHPAGLTAGLSLQAAGVVCVILACWVHCRLADPRSRRCPPGGGRP
jgi:hypothetical protein